MSVASVLYILRSSATREILGVTKLGKLAGRKLASLLKNRDPRQTNSQRMVLLSFVCNDGIRHQSSAMAASESSAADRCQFLGGECESSMFSWELWPVPMSLLTVVSNGL
jgi:hypothetical protein